MYFFRYSEQFPKKTKYLFNNIYIIASNHDHDTAVPSWKENPTTIHTFYYFFKKLKNYKYLFYTV